MNHLPIITKTDFVRYFECPLYAWLWRNRPELREECKKSRIAIQGYEIEKIARSYFCEEDVAFQVEAKTDKYLARADIFKENGDSKRGHIFEVKSSTKKKKEHVEDLCFQVNVFRQAGFEIISANLILVNSDYVYQEAMGLEAENFLKVEDLTKEVFEKTDNVEFQMKKAYKDLTSAREPCIAVLKKAFKNPPPEKLDEYYRRRVPEFSIYDVSRISKRNLEVLSERNVMRIKDIPDDFPLPPNQNVQVQLTKKETNFIDRGWIEEELANLEYPLYFLDYETINPAIPFLDKHTPYQQITFQYSLHVINEPGAELSHFDFLHNKKTNPALPLLEKLSKNIGEKGSILVWNKSFEAACNTTMAETCPKYKGFIDSINKRLYDLMVIFKEKYVDYRFKGSVSIKNVLPVLAPDLSYKKLDIQHGSMAMDAIVDLIEEKRENLESLEGELKAYCKLDTLAMVKIFEALKNL